MSQKTSSCRLDAQHHGAGGWLGRAISSALLTIALLFVFFQATAEAAAPVSWAERPWKITAAAGDRTTEKNSVTANVEINKPRLELSDELGEIASLKYDEIDVLKPGKTLKFSLVVRPDRFESNATFKGEIRLVGKIASTGGASVAVASAEDAAASAAAPAEEISTAAVTVTTVISPDKTEVTVFTKIEVPSVKGGKGIDVYVDGKKIGETDSKGELKILIKAGERRISALQPGLVGGAAFVDLVGGKKANVSVLMTGEGMSQVVEYETTSPQLPVLPADTEEFEVSFLNNKGQVIDLKSLDYLSFQRVSGGATQLINATDRFKLGKGGVIKLIPGQSLADVTSGIGVQTMTIAATSTAGFTLQDVVEYYVGVFTISGQLAAPPSTPDLALDGIPVKLTVLGSSIVLTAKSKKDGSFTFDHVPLGNVALSASTKSDGLTFTSDGALFVNADRTVKMTLLGPEDFINGVPPIEVTLASAAPVSAERARLEEASKAKVAAATPVAPAGTKSVSISATASTQNLRVKSTATLTVPKGTQSLKLTYETQTVEYPFYVLSQSIFNDLWDLYVIADDGSQVFGISRNVNSQLFVQPIWIPGGVGGTTGQIVKEFDISKFTKKGKATFTLTGSATNIGDSALTTIVNATIERTSGFIVEVIKPYSATDGQNFSIPRQGLKNTFAKGFELKITSPKDLTVSGITKVTAKALLGANAATGPVVFDRKPEKVSDKKFRVQTTFGGVNPLTSPVSGVPPAAHFVAYEFTVTATIDGEEETATVISSRSASLWKMPDGFSRYGARDTGGDDWVAFGTYQWMSSFGSLLTRVDDVSGEHGRNIGHQTHRNGTDLDIFHFGAALDSTSGTANFLAAQRLAVKAAKGNEEAADDLTNWIQAQRNGLAALAGNSQVLQLFTMPGASDSGGVLASNWAWTLLRDGKYKATVPKQGGGTETKTIVLLDPVTLSPKIQPLAGHNNHHHVTLDAASLAKP